jgi:hypothetical protein
MVNIAKAPTNASIPTQQPANANNSKHLKITEINYRRNCESDYTEKMAELDKQFDYAKNKEHYWSEPELSLFYGTPLYEESSPSQKMALNHLYWATQYNQTAATEANAVLYNQVTAGVFSAFQDYQTLCQELDLETDQERYHIHAFHNIGYKTKKALLGKEAFNSPIQQKKGSSAKGNIPGQRSPLFTFNWQSSPLSAFQDTLFRFVTNKVLLRHQAYCYSQYLQKLDQKGELIPAQTTGLLGQIAPRSFLQFFTLNCGSSPFLASVFYVTRFMANMLLKNFEYHYVQYYRELEKKGDFIPAPTAVSYNHLMDEAFHTTTSQLIAQDLYKDLPQATAYEKFLANVILYRAQQVGLSGLSGGLPGIFRNDAPFMLSFYRLLQSPVFDMSTSDALHWTQKCLCQEHDGFHLNLKQHQRLLSDLRYAFDNIDYLWSVNRELRLMDAGGSINKAIQDNVKAFEQLSKSLAQAA